MDTISMPSSKLACPYVVIRYMPAVYRRVPVIFVESDKVNPGTNVFTLVEPTPFVNGKLTDSCRAALIEGVKHACATSKFRSCLVFGEKDAVYVEPDGSSMPSTEPPSGGIDAGIYFQRE